MDGTLSLRWNSMKIIKSPFPIGCQIVVIIVMLCIFLCVGYLELTGQSGGYSLQTVILTTGLDSYGQPVNNSNTFSSKIPRIYCFSKMRGVFGIFVTSHMVFRWYHEDEMITGHLASANSIWPQVVYIEPPNGKSFEPGQYRVEVQLEGGFRKPHLRIIEFVIK